MLELLSNSVNASVSCNLVLFSLSDLLTCQPEGESRLPAPFPISTINCLRLVFRRCWQQALEYDDTSCPTINRAAVISLWINFLIYPQKHTTFSSMNQKQENISFSSSISIDDHAKIHSFEAKATRKKRNQQSSQHPRNRHAPVCSPVTLTSYSFQILVTGLSTATNNT